MVHVSVFVFGRALRREMTNMFNRGATRSGVVLMIRSMWEPASNRLQSIKSRMDDHNKYLHQWASIETMGRAERHYTKMKDAAHIDERRATEAAASRSIIGRLEANLNGLMGTYNEDRRRMWSTLPPGYPLRLTNTHIGRLKDHIRHWLNPYSCRDRLERIRSTIHPETSEWIVESEDYTTWRDSPDHGNLLWINDGN